MSQREPLCDKDVVRMDDKNFVKKTTHLIPRLPNFLTEVLYTIQTMRCKRGRGATFGEICKFMKERFGITGDVPSRVETALQKAKCDGYVLAKEGKHIVVTPIARMQRASTQSQKQSLLRDIEKTFLFKPNMRKVRRHCPSRQVELVRDVSVVTEARPQKIVSKSAIDTVLKHIECVLMKHLTKIDEEPEEEHFQCAPTRSQQEMHQGKPQEREVNLKRSDFNIVRLPERNYPENLPDIQEDCACEPSKTIRFAYEKERNISNDSKNSKNSNRTKNSKISKNSNLSKNSRISKNSKTSRNSRCSNHSRNCKCSKKTNLTSFSSVFF